MSESLGDRLAATAKTWAKARVPYKHRGTTRRGCDCTGLLIGCLRELGYARDYKLRKYPKDWNLHAMADDFVRQELAKAADLVPAGQRPRPGDIVVFYFGRCAAHAGIVTRWPLFVHCHGGVRHVAADLLTHVKWNKRLVGIYRLNEARLEAL